MSFKTLSLGAGGAVALGALISACGGGGDGKSAASPSGGAWTFTDDRGTAVRLKSRPTRVVGYVGVLAALYDFGVDRQLVGVYGPTKLKDGKPDPQAGNLPVDRLTIIGNAYGEFNIEKYASLRPELLVDNMFVKDELFYVPAESKNKIYALAPQAAISAGDVALPKPIERTAALAAALGADLKSTKVTAAKAITADGYTVAPAPAWVTPQAPDAALAQPGGNRRRRCRGSPPGRQPESGQMPGSRPGAAWYAPTSRRR